MIITLTEQENPLSRIILQDSRFLLNHSHIAVIKRLELLLVLRVAVRLLHLNKGPHLLF